MWDIWKVLHENVDWIHVAQDREVWEDGVIMVVGFLGSVNIVLWYWNSTSMSECLCWVIFAHANIFHLIIFPLDYHHENEKEFGSKDKDWRESEKRTWGS